MPRWFVTLLSLVREVLQGRRRMPPERVIERRTVAPKPRDPMDPDATPRPRHKRGVPKADK
jgi:hypothetical protein